VAVSKNTTDIRSKDKLSLLCERFLALILQGWEFCENRDFWPQPAAFPSGPLKKIFEDIIISPLAKRSKKKESFELGHFLKSLPEETIALADRLVLTDLGDVLEDKIKFKAELEKRAKEIKIYSLKKELKELSFEIQEAEQAGDKVKLLNLQKTFDKISEELGQLDSD